MTQIQNPDRKRIAEMVQKAKTLDLIVFQVSDVDPGSKTIKQDMEKFMSKTGDYLVTVIRK